jgi:O-antigen ligase
MSIFITLFFLFFLFDFLSKDVSDAFIPNFIVWLLLLLWGIYTISISPNKIDGIKYYYGLFLTPFLLFCILNSITLNENFLENVFDLFILAATILGFISIFLFVNSGFSLTSKISPVWEDYNIVSAFLMIVFMFNLSFIINNKRSDKLFLYLGTGFIILFGIFLTQTRGVWLAMLVSLLFYIIRRPKVILPSTIIIISVISILTLFFPEVITERFLSVKYFGSDISSLGRLQAWLSSIILIKENPFFGYGFDSYIYLRDQVFGFYFVLVEHSHNTYLRGILEMGLIGFFLYFLFFFSATYYTFKLMKLDAQKVYRKYLDGLQLSFIGLIIVFMFEPYFSLYGSSAIVIWFLISITYNIKSNFKSYFKTP